MLPPSCSCTSYHITIMNANIHFANRNQTILFFQPRFGNIDINGRNSRRLHHDKGLLVCGTKTNRTRANIQSFCWLISISSLIGQSHFYFAKGTSAGKSKGLLETFDGAPRPRPGQQRPWAFVASV